MSLVPGDTAHFESEISLASPQKMAVDMIWQVSRDSGVTYNDIESLTNSGGNQSISKPLDFVSDISDEGSFYRLKIIPVNSINNDPIYTEPAVLTFRAESLEFNINYVLNGGTNHPNNPSTYSYGHGINYFEAPEREGYTFMGWTDENDNPVINIGTDAQGDKTLHAKWQANSYNIIYLLNDGVNSDKNPKTYIYGQGVTSFEKARREGYTFMGWTDENGKKIEVISTQDQGDKTLYANWKKVAVVPENVQELKEDKKTEENEGTQENIKIQKSHESYNIKNVQNISMPTEDGKESEKLPLTGEKTKSYFSILGVIILLSLSLLGVKRYLTNNKD
ncbi:InlB B-repeat-containing protein [Lactococcus taiwanensis]|uniref:InlB B-repeat-containing protein n=1 Tax=Lactococcus taiwanensis TaxID=1151742 RepID=UPI001F11FAFA|nr:InlB B-repeat-containing protein [Lactococcus taiwanensis]